MHFFVSLNHVHIDPFLGEQHYDHCLVSLCEAALSAASNPRPPYSPSTPLKKRLHRLKVAPIYRINQRLHSPVTRSSECITHEVNVTVLRPVSTHTNWCFWLELKLKPTQPSTELVASSDYTPKTLNVPDTFLVGHSKPYGTIIATTSLTSPFRAQE